MKKMSGNKRRTLLNIPYTKRDIEIIYTVFTKKYITTPQIWALFFTHTKHTKVCQQRLRKLCDYGLLRAIEQAHKRGEARPSYVWALDVLGGELLISERGVDPRLINTKPRADEERSLSIKHILATTDFQIVLQAACTFAGVTLEEWLDERSVRSERMKEKSTLVGPRGETLKPPIPDALVTLVRADKRAMFHLEVDRATEDIQLSSFERQSIAGKVIEYLTWEEGEHYRREFGTRPLRVCFVTVGMRRMQNMRMAAEKVIRQQVEAHTELSEKEKEAKVVRLGKQFRFITFDRLTSDTLLTQPVWHIAGCDTPQLLLA